MTAPGSTTLSDRSTSSGYRSTPRRRTDIGA